MYTYKVAVLPFPAVFITAFSEVPRVYLAEAQEKILKTVLFILDKAQKSYKATIIINEPTSHTHYLDFGTKQNAIAVCCSLQFQGFAEMHSFIENEIKNKE